MRKVAPHSKEADRPVKCGSTASPTFRGLRKCSATITVISDSLRIISIMTPCAHSRLATAGAVDRPLGRVWHGRATALRCSTFVKNEEDQLGFFQEFFKFSFQPYVTSHRTISTRWSASNQRS